MADVNRSRESQSLSSSVRTCRAAMACTALGLFVAGITLAAAPPVQAASTDQENRLVGYKLLDQSLSDESALKWLALMRKIALHGTAKEVANLMEQISKISKQRANELEKLRKLSPDVSGDPPPSPIGDAIESMAKGMGIREMIFPDGNFNMRFVFLQAQATRMIAVIAAETAKIDPNEERKKWLGEVAEQYESLRNEIVEAVKSCIPSPVG